MRCAVVSDLKSVGDIGRLDPTAGREQDSNVTLVSLAQTCQEESRVSSSCTLDRLFGNVDAVNLM